MTAMLLGLAPASRLIAHCAIRILRTEVRVYTRADVTIVAHALLVTRRATMHCDASQHSSAACIYTHRTTTNAVRHGAALVGARAVL